MAVQSRVHLAVLYEDLDEEQIRKVWHGFLEQLDDENTSDKDEIIEWIDKWAIRSSLNGRQIRNIITSAQALARGRNRDKKLTLIDIEDVFKMTEDFQKDLEGLYKDRRVDALIEGRRKH